MRRWSSRAQLLSSMHKLGIGLSLLLATAILLASVQRHYPIEQWLFWRYAGYWLAAGLWSISCAAAGHTLLPLVRGRSLPWLEQLAVGQALGVFAFQLALFVLGMLRLYHPITFFALPAVFLASGGTSFWRTQRRALRHLRSPRLPRSRMSLFGWLAIGLGLISLVALYLPVMSPENSSFDARWRHLYIAEQYVVHGGIRRFQEGWSLGASPHFTSLLYTWGSMFPGGLLFDRVELCAHLEYVIFLWTTFAGIPALVRRLIPGANPALVWSARFLFPGTFLYDSNLSVGADHIGALFAPALFLCSLRMWRDASPRQGLLLGTFIAAAVCAKETTALLLAPFAILLVMVRFAVDLGRSVWTRRGWSRLQGGLIAGAASLLLTTPHWLKNLIWYGDPLYPNLHKHFDERPWGHNAAYTFEYGFKTMLWAPEKTLGGLREAIEALATFSFVPHSWWSMHRDVPVLGSLFTLMLLVLPFLRRTRRIWLLAACVHVSVFAWFWVHHEDRHLQALVPWMAAAVAATTILVWRSGRTITRALLVLLIGAQAVWGSDVYFFPTHSMINGPAIRATVELLGKGYLGNYKQRFEFQDDQVRIGRSVPRNAVLLVHERRDHLGYGRPTVTDVQGDQYGIDYPTLGSADRVYRHLRSLSVTHAVWLDGHSEGLETLAGDIVFFEFVHRHTLGRQRIGPYFLAELPKQAPTPPPGERLVAVFACGADYATGLYKLADLTSPRYGPGKDQFPKPRESVEGEDTSWRERVFAIAFETGCPHPRPGKYVDKNFETVAVRAQRWGAGHEIRLRR